MRRSRNPAARFLPHALATTFAVVVLPAGAVSVIETSGRPWLVIASVLFAVALSVAVATVGCAIWTRRPGSRDLVFGDLMLWGWLRRVRADRRLAKPEGLLRQLAAQLERKDPCTLGHTRRVTRHSERIAREMGLSREEVARVRIAASVHDVGKVHTPRQILVKPGRLTDEELAVIKRHPVDGAEMVAAIGDPEVTAMVLHHHERLDGSGYPDGLRSDEIPLGARIISVADTFDAMTSSRPYHAAREHQRALDVLSEEAGSRLDPDAVAAFLSYYSAKRSVAWSAFGATAPPRLVSWVGGLLHGVGGWASPLAQGFAGIAAVALVGASLGGQANPAGEPASQAAGRGSGPDREASDRPERRARGRADRGPRGVKVPGGERDNSRRGVLVGRPAAPGGLVPSEGTPTGTPSSPLPPVDAANVELPDVEVPDVELPDVELPDVEVPDVQLPAVNAPAVEVPPVELQTPQLTTIGGIASQR